MIVVYDAFNATKELMTHIPIRFLRDVAENASYTSDMLCHPNFGPSTSLWLVPGTENH